MGTTHSTHIMNATDETVVVSLTYPGAKTMLTERVTVPHNEDVTITTKYGQVTGTLMEVDLTQLTQLTQLTCWLSSCVVIQLDYTSLLSSLAGLISTLFHSNR
eukprot:GHVN01052729.1.p1 GENE.GHVN01052729.1~~GHVN01052729.1.p1  ORF type:complete len:103 (+),score=28.63 GHVN01052729.1:43-351(+)